MGIISIVQPVIGQPDTTEDVKIQNAFTILQNVINGALDTNNLSSTAGIKFSQIAAGAWIGAGAGTGYGSSGGPGVAYRVEGDRCYMRGQWENVSGSTIATNGPIVTGLPAPAYQVNPTCTADQASVWMDMSIGIAPAATTATLNFPLAAAGVVSFDNTFYPLS
jgi:hypothetical protein